MASCGSRGRRRERSRSGTFVDWLDLLTLCGLSWSSVLQLVLWGGLRPATCGIVCQACPLDPVPPPHIAAVRPSRRHLWLRDTSALALCPLGVWNSWGPGDHEWEWEQLAGPWAWRGTCCLPQLASPQNQCDIIWQQ